MAAPVFQAVGAQAAGTGAITVSWPAHVAGDVGLLVVESSGADAAPAAPSGWTLVWSAGDILSAAGSRLSVFWQRATGSSMAAASVADTGDHQVARIVTARGCIPSGTPVDKVAAVVRDTADTVGNTAAVAAEGDNLFFWFVSRPNDSTSTTTFNAPDDSSGLMTALSEVGEAGTNAGNGGGFVIYTGQRVSPGSNNVITYSKTTSLTHVAITVALRDTPAFETVVGAVDTNSARADGFNGWPQGFSVYPSTTAGILGARSGLSLYYSRDGGLTWSASASLPESVFESASDADGMLFGCTASGAYRVYYTEDFSGWAQATLPFTGNNIFRLAPKVNSAYWLAFVPGASQLARSSDGVTWESVTSPFSSLESVHAYDGKYIVFSQATNQYAYSTDLVSWTTVTITSGSKEMRYGDGVFARRVGQASAGYVWSTDLQTWTSTSSAVGFGSFAVSRGRIYVFDYNSGSVYGAPIGQAITSADRTTPTLENSTSSTDGLMTTALNHGYVYAQKNGGYEARRLRSTGAWGVGALSDAEVTSESIGTASATCTALVLSASMSDVDATLSAAIQSQVVVGNATLSGAAAQLSASIRLEYDVVSTTTMPVSAIWTAGAFGAGKYVAFAQGSSDVYVSDNGSTWTAHALPMPGTGSNHYDEGMTTYVGGRFICRARNFSGGTNTFYILTSTDGVTWSSVYTYASTPYVAYEGIAYGGGVFIVTLGAGGKYLRSTNGTSWSERTFDAGLSNIGPVAYAGGKFVAVNWFTNDSTLYSSDGLSWSTTTGGSFESLVSTSDTFYLLGSRYLYTSTDPVVYPWGSPAYDFFDSHGETPSKLFASGGKLFARISDTTGRYLTSSNGRTWRLGQRGGANQYRVIPIGGKFLTPPETISTAEIETVESFTLPGVTAAGTLTNADPNMATTPTVVVASASASLTTAARLSASPTIAVSVSAALTTRTQFAAVAAATATTTAVLTAPVLLSAVPTAVSSASAALTAQIRLSASVQVSVALSTALTTAIRPTAAAQVQVSSTAALTASIRLAAAAQGITTGESALLVGVRLVSATAGLSTAIADLTTQPRLNATASALATTSGALATAIRLVASGSAQTNQVSATLNTGIPLVAATQSVATQVSSLSTQTRFAAQSAAQATAVAGLGGTAAVLEAYCASVASVSGVLSTQIEFTSAAQAQATTSTSLTVGVLLSASRAALTTTTAALTVGAGFAAGATAQAATGAALLTGVRFVASPTAQTNTVVASLNTGIPLVGAGTVNAVQASALATSIYLSTVAGAQVTAVAALDVGAAELGASAAVATTTQGALSTQIQLAKNLYCTPACSASLTAVIRLAASTTAQTNNVLAQLSTGETVAASAAAQTSVVAAILTAGTRFVAQVQARTQTTASLTEGAALDTVGQGESTALGTLSTEISLGAVAVADAQVSAAITVGALLQAAAQAEPDAFADLDVATRFASLSAVAAYAYADLATDILMRSDAQTRSAMTGTLSQVLSGLGRSGFALVVPAELRAVSVPANDRRMVVPPENRQVLVTAD